MNYRVQRLCEVVSHWGRWICVLWRQKVHWVYTGRKYGGDSELSSVVRTRLKVYDRQLHVASRVVTVLHGLCWRLLSTTCLLNSSWRRFRVQMWAWLRFDCSHQARSMVWHEVLATAWLLSWRNAKACRSSVCERCRLCFIFLPWVAILSQRSICKVGWEGARVCSSGARCFSP